MTTLITPQKLVGGLSEAWDLDLTWTQCLDSEADDWTFTWSKGLVILMSNRDASLSHTILMDGWVSDIASPQAVRLERSIVGNLTTEDLYLAAWIP